jgi:hypothetical protein
MKTVTKRNRRKVTIKRVPTTFHFYDDLRHNFEGVTLSKDNAIIDMMCTGNIMCHKVKGTHDQPLYTPKEIATHLRLYMARMSKPAMRRYVAYVHQNYSSLDNFKPEELVPYFITGVGLSDQDIQNMSDPTLRNAVVGFDMDLTLHQFGYFTNLSIDKYVDMIGQVTKAKISYDDIGELYFGGRERFKKCRAMFQNLAKTIGMKNVYVITSNGSPSVDTLLPDMYSKLFHVRFVKGNVKVTKKLGQSKFEIIRNIMDKMS